MDKQPLFNDVQDAADRLNGVAIRTPVLEHPALNEAVGGVILLKPETLQRTGSFKFRGAYNRLSRLNSAERAKGVVAWSSGNHAQGIAAAAKFVGTQATIVMPQDAPKTKIDRTIALGATIHFYDRYTEDREKIATNMARKTEAVLVPSYDDAHIIAGQGTAAMELFEDQSGTISSIGTIDQLLIPCGGGGLTAGSVLARDGLSPSTNIFSIEPEFYDDHVKSYQSGKRETADITQESICDALLSPSPGELTFKINRTGVKAGLVVTEKEVLNAVRFAFEELKLIVEPGGAVGLAAALSSKVDVSGKTTALILSGGNIALKTLQSLL
jgi:threonine dehydratase